MESEINYGPFVIEYTYSPGCAARTHGAIENCFPAEPSDISFGKAFWVEDAGEHFDLDEVRPVGGEVSDDTFQEWLNTFQEELHEAIDRVEA